MAQRITTDKSCDWHEWLQDPERVPAAHIRTNRAGKELDLCDTCVIAFDLSAHRMDLMLRLFDPQVIERLVRLGRDPAGEQSERRSARPATPGAAANAEKSPQKTADTKTSAPAEPTHESAYERRGRWSPDLKQVRCPLQHSSSSPEEYWVEIRSRGTHAKQSHKVLGPQVPYELPEDDSVNLHVKCFKHKVCAAAGGYGFTSRAGLAMHVTKADSEGWEKEPEDAAETVDATAEAA